MSSAEVTPGDAQQQRAMEHGYATAAGELRGVACSQVISASWLPLEPLLVVQALPKERDSFRKGRSRARVIREVSQNT